jgi:hypothetical protein
MVIRSLSATVLTFLTLAKAISQEIKVVASSDNVPLPFATITNHTRPLVVSTDRDGAAHITAMVGDTLSISYVGFKTALLRFGGDKVQVVRLLPDQKALPDVTIYACKRTKEFIYKNFEYAKKVKKGNRAQIGFWGVVWTKVGNNNAKIAIRLIPDKAHSSLKDFSFWIEQYPPVPKSSILAPLLVSLYSVSDSSQMPGELISKAPIFHFPNKSGKQTINFDTLHVRIPPKGIYVSLQYIMNETYEWKYITCWKGKADSIGRDTVITGYGGRIDGVCTKDFDLVFYNSIANTWFAPAKQPIPDATVHGSIKCAATIKYCQEE